MKLDMTDSTMKGVYKTSNSTTATIAVTGLRQARQTQKIEGMKAHWLNIKMAIDKNGLFLRIRSNPPQDCGRQLQLLAFHYLFPKFYEFSLDPVCFELTIQK